MTSIDKARLRKEADALRDSIVKRDGGRCVVCGEKHYLEVHHMKAIYNGGDSSSDNLITVCKICHRFAPETGREDFEEYRKNPGKNILSRLLSSDKTKKEYNRLNIRFYTEVTQEYVDNGFIDESQAKRIMLHEMAKLLPTGQRKEASQ